GTVKTDADGRFQLKGFGRERVVELVIEGPTIEHWRVVVMTRVEAPKGLPPYTYAARFDHVVAAPQPITGTVRDKATGKPLQGVEVKCGSLVPSGGTTDLMQTNLRTTTDARGRYQLAGVPKSKQYTLGAGGGAYFISVKMVADAPRGTPLTTDFELERGLLIR